MDNMDNMDNLDNTGDGGMDNMDGMGMGDNEEDPMMNHGDDGMMHGDMAVNGTMTNETMVDMGDDEDMMMEHGGDDGQMDHSNMNHNHDDLPDDPTAGMGNMNHDDHSNMNHDDHSNMDNTLNTDHSNHLHGVVGDSNGFCTGSTGMVMIMDGFQWALKGESQCINLYFQSWTLDSVGKFVGAMIGVVLLGMSTEGISRYRHNLNVKSRTASLSECKKLSYIQTGLHGVHAFVGYILMLATMTYSMELLLSVILGLVIGYAVFGGDSYAHVSTNPCCAFLEDEAIERDTNIGAGGAGQGGGTDGPLPLSAVTEGRADGDCCSQQPPKSSNNKNGSALSHKSIAASTTTFDPSEVSMRSSGGAEGSSNNGTASDEGGDDNGVFSA